MRRSVYLSGPCGCSMPGFAKLLDREIFEQAAERQGLQKGRRKPKPTEVGRYVETKHSAAARKVLKSLRVTQARVKPIILKAYAKKAPQPIEKADAPLSADEQLKLVQSIIDQLDSDDTGTDLSGSLEPAMTAAFKRAASLGGTQVGFEFDRSIVKQMDVRARDYAANRSAELVTDLGYTTLSDLQGLVARAVEEGMSTDELSDAIDDMGAFGESRSETIARTELASAHVQGNVEGWKETGEVESKESILGDLHDIDDVCDDCADAGETPLDDDFVDGYDFPPYHPNCICDIKPVLKDDTSGDE